MNSKKSLSSWFKQSRRILLALCFSLFATTPLLGQELSKLPFVPTPQVVVDEMLKMADVSAKDFVIDLGSGDGRIVITADKRFKASGFGVDIEPKLVALANEQAKSEGVEDRVAFHERDMFKTDISKASILALYVLPNFMNKLRSKVLTELKPGSRVVAHDYSMGDWYPDRQLTLTVPEKVEANGTDKAYIYLWIVPSRVSGSWRLNLDSERNSQSLILTFKQQFQMLSAVATSNSATQKIENASLKGDGINFSVSVGTNRYQFTGRVVHDKMEGNAIAASGSKPLPWRATRIAAGN